MFLIIIALFSSAFAQETYYADTVIVEATRRGYSFIYDFPSVTTLEPDTLPFRFSRDLVELLADNVGIIVGRYGYAGGTGSLRLRGENASVCVDGFLVNIPQLGQFDILWFPAPLPGSTEIVMGPSSSFYGSDGLGGAFNILPPRFEGLNSRINIGWGGYSISNIDADLESKIGELIKYRIALSERKSDGPREGEGFNAKGLTSYISGEGDSPYLWLMRNNLSRKLPPPEPFVGDPAEDKTELTMIESGYSRLLSEKLWTAVKLLYQDFNEEYLTSEHDNENLSGRAELLYIFGKAGILQLKFGGTKARVKSSEAGKHTLNKAYSFISVRESIIDNLDLLSAIRVEKPYKIKSNISPFLGLKYDGRAYNLYGEIRYGWREPTLNDLFWSRTAGDFTGDSIPDYITEGNPNLTKEQSLSALLGVKLKENLRLNLFWSRVQDKIVWQNIDPTLLGGHWKPVNIPERTYMYGADIRAHYKYKSLSVNTFATLLNTKTQEEAPLPYRPSVSLAGNLAYGQLVFRDALEVQSAISFRWWDGLIDELGQEMDNPFILNLVLGFRVAGVNLCFMMENLLNKEYSLRRGYPLGERNYIWKLRIELEG